MKDKFKTLKIGHATFRPDVPQLIERRDRGSKVETTTLDIGSYTGSECLSIGVKIGTYHLKSDRLIEKHGHISVPYSDIGTMELLRDTIERAIADAKEWQANQTKPLVSR